VAGGKLSKELAEKILAKFNTVDKATSVSGKDKEKYLQALDTVYGDRAKRSADLGFSDGKWYHGTEYSETPIEKFNESRNYWNSSEKRGMHVTDTSDEAAYYSANESGEQGAIYPLRTKLETQNHPNIVTNTTVPVNEVRSVNANFDPRFKDSANIMALQGSNVNPFKSGKDLVSKIANKISQAYQGSTLEKADTARDEALNTFAKQTDLYRAATGRDDTQFQNIAKTAADFVVPGTVDALTPFMKGVKATGIASKIVEKTRKAEAANELARVQKVFSSAAVGEGVSASKALGNLPDKRLFGGTAIVEKPEVGLGKVVVKP
jgi:hypothetical protein